jgi:hypothetical protein
MQASTALVERLLVAHKAPSDFAIAWIADRNVAPVATALLLDLIGPFTNFSNNAALDLFLPRNMSAIHAFNCGVVFKCFPDRGNYTPDVLGKLRARTDINAVLARYACGDLRDWRRADKAARAVLILRDLIELRSRNG